MAASEKLEELSSPWYLKDQLLWKPTYKGACLREILVKQQVTGPKPAIKEIFAMLTPVLSEIVTVSTFCKQGDIKRDHYVVVFVNWVYIIDISFG